MNEWLDYAFKSIPYVCGAVAWAIRQEIRANRQEDKMNELQKTVDEDRRANDEQSKLKDAKLDKILDLVQQSLISQARTEEQIKTLFNDRNKQ